MFVPKIIGHDIEEFNAIVQRHGDWLGEVAEMEKAVKDYQMNLFTPKDATVPK